MTTEEQNRKLRGIARFKEVVGLFADDPATQARLQGKISSSDFARILSEKGVSDVSSLWQAHEDLVSPPTTAPQTSQPSTTPPTPQGPVGAGGLGAVGALAGIPLTLLSREKDPAKYKEKDLEKAANDYASKNVSIFIRDKAKRAAALDAKRQEFHDRYASDPRYREHARQLASTSQNRFLHKAIEKDNATLRQQFDKEARSYARKRVVANRVIRGSTSDREVVKAAIQQSYNQSYRSLAAKNPLTAQGLAVNTTNAPLLRASQRNLPQRPGLHLPGRLGKVRGASKKVASEAVSAFRKRARAIIFGSVISSIIAVFFVIALLGGPGVAGYSGEGGNPTGGSCVTPMPLSEVPKYIHIGFAQNSGAAGFGGSQKGQHLNSEQMNFVYKAFATPLGSKTYFNLLTNNGKDYLTLYFFDRVIDPDHPSRITSSGGAGWGPRVMAFWGFFETRDAYPHGPAWQSHLLIHESGHSIQQNFGRSTLGFDVSKFSSSAQDSSACYDNNWLRTYAFRDSGDCAYPGSTGINQKSREAEAEAIGNNVFCAPGKDCNLNEINCARFINYQKVCSNTYAWIREHIFGGDDFFNCSSVHKFAALGDSLTAWPDKPAGFVLSPSCADNNSCDGAGGPWPTHLSTADKSFQLTKNASYPAKTSGYIYSQLNTAINPVPDILFVLVGANDTDGNTINNLKKIIAGAQAAKVQKVIILTIPHQCSTSYYSGLNRQILTLNSGNSPVIDISGSSVLSCSDFQIDHLHLTNDGATKLANYIDSQLKKLGL